MIPARPRNRPRFLALAPALLTLLYVLAPRPASAQADFIGNFQDAVRLTAEEVLKIVKDEPVAIGQITPVGLPDANGGPAIGELLKNDLEALRPGSVRRKAPFEVKGDFNLVPHPDAAEAAQGQKIVRILFRVIKTETGEEVGLRLTRNIRDNASILRLANPSGPLPLDPGKSPTEQRRERNLTIQKNIDDPKVFIDPARPTLVSSSQASPFKVEILAGPAGPTRPTSAVKAVINDGFATVDIPRGQVYEIRIHNTSSEEIAAQVFIDGLDIFHFSADRNKEDSRKPQFSHFIVPPRGTEDVPGWHRAIATRPNFVAFLVTTYGQGASSRAGVPATGPVGIIQVQLSKCHEKLPGNRSRGSTNETGFGPPRNVDATAVEREIEPPTDAVSIRYSR